jgi:hypothetical protein
MYPLFMNHLRFHQFQGSRGAYPHAFRFSFAQIALEGFFHLRIPEDDADGAVFLAKTATDAGLPVYEHGPGGFVPGDGAGGAYAFAKGIFAMAADHRFMNQVFPAVADGQNGTAGVISAEKAFGTDKLTDAAAGAKVEIGFNESQRL